MAAKAQASAAEESWNVVSSYLNAGEKTTEGLTNSVRAFVKDEKVLELAVNAVLGKVDKGYFESLTTFGKMVAYDGFNPQTIILEMASRAEKSKQVIMDDATFNFDVDGLSFVLPKRAHLAKDVQMLVTLFLVRGNNLYKILKTIGKDAKTAISSKMVTYSIKSDDDQEAAARRKEKVILSSKDVTLSRVAASFPHITLAIAKFASIPGKANLIAIRLQAKLNGVTSEMPYILQHGFLAALLSRGEPLDQLDSRQFCYMFNLEQTITLQPPSVKKNMLNEILSSHIDSCTKFVSAAISGPMTDDSDRSILLKGLIGDEDKAFKEWTKAGSDAWLKALTATTYSSLTGQLSADVQAAASKTSLSPEV